MALTATQRSARARTAAYAKHARTDGRSATAAARRGSFARFIEQVDPGRTLTEAERTRRALLAQKAHMGSLAARSAQVRAKRRRS